MAYSVQPAGARGGHAHRLGRGRACRHHRPPHPADRTIDPGRQAPRHQSDGTVLHHVEVRLRTRAADRFAVRRVPCLGVPGAGAVPARTPAHRARAVGGRRAVPRRRHGSVLVAAAARSGAAARHPARCVRSLDHGGQVLRVRGAADHRSRGRCRTAARHRDSRRARARVATVPGAQPALRAGGGDRRRGAARATRRRVHAPHDGAPVCPVRGRHLVRLGGGAAARAPGSGDGGGRRSGGRWRRGERGAPCGVAARRSRPTRRSDAPGAAARPPGHHAAHAGGVSRRNSRPRHRGRAPARAAHRAPTQLPARRRRDRLASQDQGLPRYPVPGRHAHRAGRGHRDDPPAGRSLRGAGGHEARVGLDPLPPAQLPARRHRGSALVRGGDGNGGRGHAVRHVRQARDRTQGVDERRAGVSEVVRARRSGGGFRLDAAVWREERDHVG